MTDDASAPPQAARQPDAPDAQLAGLSASPRPVLLPFFMLAEPLVSGRVVVELLGDGGPGVALLRHAGAVDVLSFRSDGPPWLASDGSADVVMVALHGANVRDEKAWRVCLRELHRILRPNGFCLLRVPAADLIGEPATDSHTGRLPTRPGMRPGASVRAVLADRLLEDFGVVDIVEEAWFGAVSFFVPGTDDLAVNEGVVRLAGPPEHLVAVCGAERLWELQESLLVPTGLAAGAGTPWAGELAGLRDELAFVQGRAYELASERDGLRDANMTLQDRAERLERTVGSLRREVERYLRQITDAAAARELTTLERDGLQRRLAQALERTAEDERELEQRQAAIRALENEVARLRAARGQDPASGGRSDSR
jgi:hypothetical protein